MNKDNLLMCCDWGTSNFRLYLVEKSTERILGHIKNNNGIAATYKKWEAQGKSNKTRFFQELLNEKINHLAKNINEDLTKIPVVLSGMASSSLGVVEVPYASLPFSIPRPVLNFEKITDVSDRQNDLYVFGGLRSAEDVMRGEEVQLIGLQKFFPSENFKCILPGTHSKHVEVANGKVVDFKTYMTGEIFNLLEKHSILKNSVSDADVTFQKDFFQKGVTRGINENLLNNVFTVRTQDILDKISTKKNKNYLSGLLIGHELKSISNYQGAIVVAANSSLFKRYKVAMTLIAASTKCTFIAPENLKNAIPSAHIHLMKNLKNNHDPIF
ncbi:MAG: 2-dehydro-3-deoxygalactonokinase [Bacteroidota bacterium]